MQNLKTNIAEWVELLMGDRDVKKKTRKKTHNIFFCQRTSLNKL